MGCARRQVREDVDAGPFANKEGVRTRVTPANVLVSATIERVIARAAQQYVT